MNCVYRDPNSVCRLPIMAGPTTDDRCALCIHYRGPLRGLGDVVARVTNATGIATAVHAVAPNCGCGGRMNAMNRAVPFADRPTKDAPNGIDV